MYITDTNTCQSFIHTMVTKTNWHRYGTKSRRHSHPVYTCECQRYGIDARGALYRRDEAVALRVRHDDVPAQGDGHRQPAPAADVVGHLPGVRQPATQQAHARTRRTARHATGSLAGRSILSQCNFARH